MEIVSAATLGATNRPQSPQMVDGEVTRTRPITARSLGWSPGASAGLEGSIVRFSPTARTKWHRHPGGQVLFVLQGSGLIGTEWAVERVEAGDLIVAESDECHWHGAGPVEEMVHLVVTPDRAVWSKLSVTEDEYGGGLPAVDSPSHRWCRETAPRAHAPLRELVAILDRTSIWISASEPTRMAATELEEALAGEDAARTEVAALALSARLELMRKLTDLRDKIDPHVLYPEELKRLRAMDPGDLVDDALLQGRLRERRILVEAMEAATNRLAARIAVGAAILTAITALVLAVVN